MQNHLSRLRNLVTLSPRITVLSAIVLIVFGAMIFLGIAVIQQSAAARLVLGYNNADVSRPFVQLQRETLKMNVAVRSDPAKFDPKAAELQRNLVQSRMVVLNYPLIQESLPPESREASAQINKAWADIEPLIEQWKANYTDTDLAQKLSKALVDFEFLVNATEIRYQFLRGEVVETIGGSSEMLLLVLGSLSLILLLFVSIVGISVYRFFQESQKAEAEKRHAIAAEAAALETNRFKDQFLAVMSHELRTPLNAIIGFLGIIGMSKDLSERNKHMTERARANADRLLALINDILDLSKIESGRLELIPTQIASRELAQRWESQMDVLAKQKGLTFKVEIDDSVPQMVFVDEDAITKMVTNLLGNAFKFTEKGSVTLRMRFQDEQWMIEVQDTGIGIPSHMHERIFEAFRQVDSFSRRAHGGTGLGLSIVERLCKAMNGTIRLKSVIDEGSTFTLVLPITPVEKHLVPAVEI